MRLTFPRKHEPESGVSNGGRSSRIQTPIHILAREFSMGFNDLFKHREHGHYNNHGNYCGDHHDHHGGVEKYIYLFEKLKNHKKLLIMLSVTAIIIIILVIAVVIMLIPVFLKWFEVIQKSGIKGLIESASPMLERLWSGTGK